MSREYTKEECRDRFLAYCESIRDTWAKAENQTPEEKLDGFLFSMLVLIDGGSMGCPGFHLVPAETPDDVEYLKEQGEDHWPALPDDARGEAVVSLAINAGDALHEVYSMRKSHG